jgi:hypothetical protein
MSNKANVVNNLLNKSASYAHGKNKNSTNNKNNKNNEEDEKGIFTNVYLVGSILGIALTFIGYSIYYNMNTNKNTRILDNSSYYGIDIISYDPLFKETVKKIDDCINMCSNNILCDGITYNSDTKMCTGTKNGAIRNENASFSSWVKPFNESSSSLSTNFIKSLLIGYANKMKNIDGSMIRTPYSIGFFTYSFNLTIYDFNINFGKWRHIFHKGTPILSGTTLNYQSWENLVKDIPVQSIGVWLAPFTNNLRIAVTTTSLTNKNNGVYPEAFIEKCNSITSDCYVTDMPNGKWVDKSKAGDDSIPNTRIDTNIEFFDNDLQNIPINKQVNITINFMGTSAEVYFDAKIIKVVKLDGTPIMNKTSLYAMNDKTIGGEINNLLYYPDSLKISQIQDVFKLAPSTSSTLL